jgi:hypothetical protein
LVITPVVILWATLGRIRFARRKWIEAATAYTSGMVIGSIAFSPLVTQTGTARPLAFLAISSGAVFTRSSTLASFI